MMSKEVKGQSTCNAPFPDAPYIKCDQPKGHDGRGVIGGRYPDQEHSVSKGEGRGKETITWPTTRKK